MKRQNEYIKRFEKSLAKYCEKAAKEEKEEAEEKRKEKKMKKTFKQKEKKFYNKKLKLYKDILEWRDRFIKRKNFKRMFDAAGKNPYCGMPIFSSEKLGHVRRRGWSEVMIDIEGTLSYEERLVSCVMTGTGVSIDFDDEGEAINEISYDYLKDLHSAIKTGKVYKNVAKEIEEYEKLECDDEDEEQ